MKSRLNLNLFWTFFKIGLFTFGGGYAMIALIESICVERKNWITHDEMTNLTVLAESTPGPIAINCATFVGYKQNGFWGAVLATLGVVLPSFFVILAVSSALDLLLSVRAVQSAFSGIRIAVGLLIISAAINMIKKLNKKPLEMLILVLSAAAMLAINILSLNFSSIALMLIAAAVGFVFYMVSTKTAGKDGEK